MVDAHTKFNLINPDGGVFGPADIAMLQAWAREGRVSSEARLQPLDGGPATRASDHPALAGLVIVPGVGMPPFSAPATAPGSSGQYAIDPRAPMHRPRGATDGLAALIPTSNPAALTGYYLGVFSLIPCLGLPLAVGAIVCGITGLARVRADPSSRGRAHAIVAIVLGSLVCVGTPVVIALLAFL